MKKSILFSFLFVSLFGHFASAKSNDPAKQEPFTDNEMMATVYAGWISKIQSPQDVIENFIFSEKDQKLIEADFSKIKKENWKPIKVTLIQPTKLMIEQGDQKMFLSFRQFDKSNLYVNDQLVKMEPFKTYLNYKAEIEAIVSQSQETGEFSIFKKAYAQARRDCNRNTLDCFVASTASSASNSAVLFRGFGQKYVVPEAQLNETANVLVRAFANEAEKARKNGWKGFQAFTFKCEGPRLKSLEEQTVKNGQLIAYRNSPRLVATGSRRYRYSDILCDNVVINSQGRVLSGISERCVMGPDAFNSSPLYQFPLVAEQCCQIPRCAAQVTVGIQRVIDSTAPSRAAPARRSRSTQ